MNDASTQPSICIIGGGAAGISTAYFLKKNGYKNVIVLEKDGRIGGKCYSITVQGRSFDLGANYITSSYANVKKLAAEFGAPMYTEGKLNAFDEKANQISSLLKAVLKTNSIFKIGWLSLKYIFKRWRLNRVISPKKPGFKDIARHPELCQPFHQWLEKNGLSGLEVLFQIPITLMGYGQLKTIPTAYALTYMTNPTFIDLVTAAISPYILGYPKRFTEGYQRLLDRIAWQVEVKVGAEVTNVKRGKKIQIEYNESEETLGLITKVKRTLSCDYVVVATPLFYEILSGFMKDFNETETSLFKKVTYDPFIVTTYSVAGLEEFTAATFLIPEPPYYEPFVITRQFADNNLISFYTRAPYGQAVDKDRILKANKDFMMRACSKDIGEYFTYSEFPYFPHVDSEAMKGNFYGELEALQGKQNTFYTGGLMNFELVETIINYSRVLVAKNFPEPKS